MSDHSYTQEEANQFILDCHGDLEAVKRKVAEKPALVNAYNPDTDEKALGASSHIGNRQIAEFLLDNGAELDIACAAMLGRVEAVADFLEKDPNLATSGGAHGIPIAFHAALGGSVEIAEMLLENGAEAQLKGALMGAIFPGRAEMVRWLLAHGANLNVKDFQGNSPLDVAEKAGHAEIVEMLKEEGAEG